MAKKKFSDWFWSYTYNNWKLTPKSKGTVIQAGAIILGSILVARKITKL